MVFAKQVERFRAAVAALGPRTRNTPYPMRLRRVALDYAAACARTGGTLHEAAQALGVGTDSLRRWSRAAAAARRAAPAAAASFAPVEVVEATGLDSLVLHGPACVRVEGLSLAALADLLRRLS